MKKGVFFDLDGTLWDSAENVCKAWNEVFSSRIPQLHKTITVPELHGYMGKTLDDIAALMFPDIESEKRMEIMNAACDNENAYLAKHGGVLYPDVASTLEKLRERYSLYIVSNCQAGYIETFLGFYGLGYLFEDFECPGRTGQGKAANIKLVMERNGVSRAVYIGDTQGDLEASDEAGAAFIHAAYGFGTVNRDTPQVLSFGEIPAAADEILGK